MPMYAAGLFLYGFACFFVLPYALGAGAVLDSTGRAATLAGATVFIAGAVSPAIGGIIQDMVSVSAVGWTAGASCLVAVLCAFSVRRTLRA
jgi:predicted MFS family arabinose efflux permease